jgi:hypothetical protein
VLAYDYPLLDIFWTMLWFFVFFIWVWLVILVLADIFRSGELSGWGKALWVLFVVAVPLLGVLVYFLVRGRNLNNRGGGGGRPPTGPTPAGPYPYMPWR